MYAEIYVHASLGDDNSEGTLRHPYRTIKKAVETVYDIAGKTDEECNVNIMLGCGVNKIDSVIVIENPGKNIYLTFKPWDDMYTTISCAERVSGFDFEYDEEKGVFCYNSNSDVYGFYLNGQAVESVSVCDDIRVSKAYVSGKYIEYMPGGKNDFIYSVTELAGRDNGFILENCSNVSFKNIEFTGIGNRECSYVKAKGCTNIKFEGCKFKNSSGKAVEAEESEVSAVDCEFINQKNTCINSLGKSDFVISNCYFENCTSGSIVCKTEDGENNISVISCTFSGTYLPVVQKNRNVFLEFSRNRVENDYCCGFVIDSAGDKKECKIDSNIIITNTSGDSNKENGTVAGENGRYLIKSECGGFTYYNLMTTKLSKGICNGILRMSGNENDIPDTSETMCITEECKAADRIDLNAGYRRKIRNYGDII